MSNPLANLNIRGSNMPRRKKKIINNNFKTKLTENGRLYNNNISIINKKLLDLYNHSEEIIDENITENIDNNQLYLEYKEIILDKLEIIGASLDQTDLLKKSKYNFKNDIKEDYLEFIMSILLVSNEEPLQFNLNIYDSILIKNFKLDYINEIIIEELQI
tara:strand:- start:1658 stop:2137 length:480 start_codon:yes stop_codon:yes gene_type:complete